MKIFHLLFLSVLGACGPFLFAQEAEADSSASVGPVTSDAEAIAAFNLDAPGMDKVKAAVQSGDLAAIQQAYLDYRRTSNPAKWKVMPSDEPATAGAATDSIGDDICEHHIRDYIYKFPFTADMGKDFDWTFNPTPRSDPGFTFEWTYCVISRMGFWRKLADAYWKTLDEKYAVEWVNELKDFAVKNPVNHDHENGRVELWRTLDASIRMDDTWPYAYAHFLNSPSFTPEANWIYYKMVLDHATFLVNNLKTNDHTGNWISTQCFGIYTMGTLFPELKDASSWRDMAIERMTRELTRMVPPDGYEAELTPTYHTVALDGFRGPLELATLNHAKIPDLFRDKVLAMYRALVIVMDQSGNVVQTNDCGSVVNAAKLAKHGLALGNDPLLQWAVSGGTSGTGLPDSTMLPYAGFYTMRSGWKLDDQFLFFRAGPTGIGHQHEDMLEVALRAWNKTLIFDPGSYGYDHSDWRRFAINTPSHSTIIVDGKWQHRGPSPAPVEKTMDNPWVTTPLFDFVAGTYDGGYQKNVYDPKIEYHPEDWVGEIDHSVTHTRRVLYLRPYYALLVDTLDGTGTHTFDSHFQLDAPAAHVDPATQAAFSDNEGDVQIGLYPLERENLAVDIVQGQKDPLLGWQATGHRPIPTVRFRKQQDAPAIFATFLYPYKGSAPAFKSAPLDVKGEGIWSQTLTTAQENAEVALVRNGTSQSISFKSQLLGAVNADAAGIVIRQPINGVASSGGWGITSYSDDKTQFTVDAPANLVMDPQGTSVFFFNGGDKAVNLTLVRPFAQTVSLPPGVRTEVTSSGAQPAPAQ